MDVQTKITLSVIATCILSFVGCSSAGLKSTEPLTVTFDGEAASTHISIDSVGSWYDYSEALQPNFKITEKGALDAVVPTNLHFEEVVKNAFGATLKLSPSTSSISESFTTTFNGDGSETEEGTKTRTKSSGDASNITIPNTVSLLSNRTSDTEGTSDDSSEQPSSSPNVGIDPFLRYSAATSLYQEVELINRYIEDAAFKRDHVPYLVRLNINLMPKARNLPYDTYINVSMFSQGNDAEPPTVLPLLVSDNIEAAMQSRSNSDLLHLAFGLSLLNAGNFGSVGLDSYSEDFQSVFGRDMNSLLSVTRSSSNTLKIRLGANLSSGSVYSMIPRNHKISFVVLVPKGVSDIRAISKSEFVHATEGKALKANTSNYIKPKVVSVLKAAGCSEDFLEEVRDDKSDFTTKVLDSVLNSQLKDFKGLIAGCVVEKKDEETFFESLIHQSLNCPSQETIHTCIARNFPPLNCKACDESSSDSSGDELMFKKMHEYSAIYDMLNVDSSLELDQLWVSLTRINEDRNINIADISLPQIATLAEIFDSQTVLVSDDGKKSSKGAINGIIQSSNSKLYPVVTLDDKKLVPSSFGFDRNTGVLSFTIPSLKAMGLVEKDRLTSSNNCVSIYQMLQDDPFAPSRAHESDCMPIHWYLEKGKSETKDAAFKLRSSSKLITSSNGKGELSFYVDIHQKKDESGASKPASTASISIDGAAFALESQNSSVSIKADGLEVTNSALVKLTLNNLSESHQVVVTGKDKEKVTSNILSFPIREMGDN
ncbi:hypothetical protein [Alteromonas portus]|uniref:hypothetical protein n=1 Tax=Alteromonas portus TaxID=2565549 RepID=UPI003BF86102